MSQHLASYLLGPPKLELNNEPVLIYRRTAWALLSYLAANPKRYAREYLSALLWPDHDRERAFTSLRHLLWEIQQVIGEGWIAGGRETIEFNPAADIWVETNQFQSLIQQSQTEQARAVRVALLIESVQFDRSHFLTGFLVRDAPHINEWIFDRSEDLRERLARGLTLLSEVLCSAGQPEEAIPHARRLVGLDPLNEGSHRLLMEIYVEAGQHSAALKQYQTCERILRTELGVDPQPETRAFYRRLRR